MFYLTPVLAEGSAGFNGHWELEERCGQGNMRGRLLCYGRSPLSEDAWHRDLSRGKTDALGKSEEGSVPHIRRRDSDRVDSVEEHEGWSVVSAVSREAQN